MSIKLEHIDDFCSSEHFLFVDSQSKQYAQQLLSLSVGKLTTQPSINLIEELLNSVAAHSLPLSIRKAFPELLGSFLTYLSSRGSHPEAAIYNEYLAVLKTTYLTRFRDDGSVRGATYTKNYTKTSRNDPCPCGSGKKFKKCCAV
jgi:hypothetical protein